MQSKTVAASSYDRPIQVLAELLEMRTVSEKGSSPWPICELVRTQRDTAHVRKGLLELFHPKDIGMYKCSSSLLV